MPLVLNEKVHSCCGKPVNRGVCNCRCGNRSRTSHQPAHEPLGQPTWDFTTNEAQEDEPVQDSGNPQPWSFEPETPYKKPAKKLKQSGVVQNEFRVARPGEAWEF